MEYSTYKSKRKLLLRYLADAASVEEEGGYWVGTWVMLLALRKREGRYLGDVTSVEEEGA